MFFDALADFGFLPSNIKYQYSLDSSVQFCFFLSLN